MHTHPFLPFCFNTCPESQLSSLFPLHHLFVLKQYVSLSCLTAEQNAQIFWIFLISKKNMYLSRSFLKIFFSFGKDGGNKQRIKAFPFTVTKIC